jgi:hypothetical protein
MGVKYHAQRRVGWPDARTTRPLNQAVLTPRLSWALEARNLYLVTEGSIGKGNRSTAR